MLEDNKIKVAIVGAGREGLETLAIFRKEPHVSVQALIDPDNGALGFRLEEYGYSYADDLNLRLSNRLRDLATVQYLNLIVDTNPQKHHRELYALDIHSAEIMNGHSASFIWGLTDITDIEKRRSVISGQANSVIESIKQGLSPVTDAPALDESINLILRTSFLGTHATSAQLTLLAKDGPYKIIRDINVEPDLLIKKGYVRPYIKEWDDADSIIRYVVENKKPWEGTEGLIEGIDTLSVIPLIEGSDVVGMLWFYYISSNAHFSGDDAKFITASLAPLLGDTIKGSIETANSRLLTIERSLSTESSKIIQSDRPIGSKIIDVNQAISRLLDAEDSHVYIKDPATGDLVLQATTSKFPSLLGRMRIARGRGVLNEVIEREKPLLLMEADTGNGNLSHRFAKRDNNIAFLYIPLIIKKEGVGIIAMEFTTTRYITPDTHKALIDMGNNLASTVSSDVERYRMSQKIIKLSAVNEEGIEILSTVDLHKGLALAAASSAMLLDSEVSILRLYENEQLAVKSTYGLHEDKTADVLLDMDLNISTMVSQTKVPVLIHDLLEYSDVASPAGFPYKTAIVVPVFYEKRLLGTLSLYNKISSGAFSSIFFTEDDREIMERFILYVARGVINARRYSERQSLITIDEVSGLRNERYLQIRFPEEIKRAKRYNRCVSLIFFEIKPFDESIVLDVSKMIKDTFRYIDVLVRLKNAKFVALLPDTGEGVKDAVGRLSASFNMLKVKRPELTLFVGYSSYPQDSEDIHELIKKSSRLSQC